MISLPRDTNGWKQNNASDRSGHIIVTKNITFDNDGYIRLSSCPKAIMNESIDADFDEPMVITRSQDYGYFIQTIDSPFEINEDRIGGYRPTQIATAGAPAGALHSDASYFGGLFITSKSSSVDFYTDSTNTWANTNISLTNTAGAQHPVEPIPSLNALAVGNVNTVLLYDKPITATPTLLKTLTILADYYVTSLCFFNQNIYVGTMNRYGGHALLYVWNGFSEAAQAAFEVDSNIIYDVCMHQDSVVIFTGKGQLQRFNGSGFTTLDSLPTYYDSISISDETNIDMYHNCLKSSGEQIYINVSTDGIDNKPINSHDGIWCYDSRLGFMYHRYAHSISLAQYETISTDSVNTTDNKITVGAAPITGTEVLYNSAGSTVLGGLADGAKYYTIKVDGTTVQLATTYANAIAGTAIDLTGTGNSSQTLIFFPQYDFGQSKTGRVGAVGVIERILNMPTLGAELLFGGALASTSSTGGSAGHLNTIFPTVDNRGYFVTSKFFSDEASDFYPTITLLYSTFRGDRDKIVVKYRTEDDNKDYIDFSSNGWLATWTSTTTFTTTQSDFVSAKVGDEIEFLKGGGAGILAHITEISLNTGTYTVTIDEPYTYYTSGDTARFVFRNWKKLGAITSSSPDYVNRYEQYELGRKINGKFLQLKIELRGVQTRIEGIRIDNKTYVSSSK